MKTLFLATLFALTATISAHAYPPYYDIADREKAQAEAKERHLPLAWFGGFPDELLPATSNVERSADSQEGADLSQMAMDDLQNQAVVIFFDGHNMSPVPAIVHAEDHIADDGPLSGGASWNPPKIVFTNADVTRVLGRVSHTQMKAEGQMAINSVLKKIDPTMLADASPPIAPGPATTPPAVTPAAPATSPDDSPIDSSPPSNAEPSSLPPATSQLDQRGDDLSPEELQAWNGFRQNGVYIGIGLGILLVLLRALSVSKDDS